MGRREISFSITIQFCKAFLGSHKNHLSCSNFCNAMSQFHPSIGFDCYSNDATILIIPAIKIKKCNFVSKLFDLLFVPAKIRIEFFVHSYIVIWKSALFREPYGIHGPFRCVVWETVSPIKKEIFS